MNAHIPGQRSPRTRVMLRASVFSAGEANPSEHRVVNLSETGLCLAQVRNLSVDTIVVVTIGEVEHAPADVVWTEAGQAGLKFHSPIDLAAARTLSKRAGNAPPPATGWMAELSSPYLRKNTSG